MNVNYLNNNPTYRSTIVYIDYRLHLYRYIYSYIVGSTIGV